MKPEPGGGTGSIGIAETASSRMSRRRQGVRGEGFSIGAATADYDNDGYADLFVAGVKHNALYHNRGDGTFEDVTAKAGIHDELLSGGRRMVRL